MWGPERPFFQAFRAKWNLPGGPFISPEIRLVSAASSPPQQLTLKHQRMRMGTGLNPPNALLYLPKQKGVFGFCFGVATLTCKGRAESSERRMKLEQFTLSVVAVLSKLLGKGGKEPSSIFMRCTADRHEPLGWPKTSRSRCGHAKGCFPLLQEVRNFFQLLGFAKREGNKMEKEVEAEKNGGLECLWCSSPPLCFLPHFLFCLIPSPY